jgi:chloramphenicol-sensitive protein RarD
MAVAAGAYSIWGLAPIYWKAVTGIPATEVLIPRILWTLILLLVVAQLAGRHAETWSIGPRGWGSTLIAALLLATNWGLFIFAVQSDQVLATSLGYYINPLVSILLGLLILRERLEPTQAAAVAIAALGVATMTIQAGELPWISLGLAGSFALYGLSHKLSPQPPIAGLTREMLVLTPLALLALVVLATRDTEAALVRAPLGAHALLSLAGLVTAAPLLLFHAATRRLPLIAVGMFQYIAPTLTLVLAVAVYGESFTPSHAIGFGCVWLGLGVFSFDSLRRTRALANRSTGTGNFPRGAPPGQGNPE